MHKLGHVLTTLFFFALTEVLGVLCFSVRRSSTRWLVFLALSGVIYWQLYHSKLKLNNPTAQYGIGCRLGGILCVIFEPMLKGRRVLEESRWVGDKTTAAQGNSGRGNGASSAVSNGEKGEKLNIEKASFSKRFFWALSLYSNPRAVGWAHGNPSVLPPRPSSWSTRKGFMSSQITHILAALIIQELNIALMRRSPYFLGQPIPDNAPHILKTVWFVHRGIGEGLSAATGTIINLSLNAIVWVALGLSDIASWCHLYGTIADAYTVRNFWGKTWHQIFRRSFGLIGNTLADTVHLPRRSKLRSYFVLSIAFMLSTALHSVGDFVLVGSWRKTKAWTLFMPQIAAIWFEDAVIKLGRQAGFRKNRLTTMLGYAWVILWFGWVSGPMVEIHAAREGYFAAMIDLSMMA